MLVGSNAFILQVQRWDRIDFVVSWFNCF